MDILPRFLQYGEQVTRPARSLMYHAGDPVGEKPIYYVIAGLVKVEYPLRESTFTLWSPPDSMFGLVEALAESDRLCVVHTMERTILYQWDLEGFFTAAGVSWELALAATTGLTRELRILNAEFGERLGILEGGRTLMDAYNEIMKIAFQAEDALDEAVIARFGKRFTDKQILIREGDIQQKIFWILSGEVYITRRMGEKYKVLTTLGKGEFIGEMSFFDKSVRSATVIAKGAVHALEFTKENFADIYSASPLWTRRLLVSLSKRIRLMVQKLKEF